MAQCVRCGKPLTADEIGLHKKLYNRGATEHLCITCVAADLHCEEALLRRKIEEFRRQGCTLFAPL